MSSGISMLSSVILPVFIGIFIILSIIKGSIGHFFAALLLFVVFSFSLGLTVEKGKIIRHIYVFHKSIHHRVLRPEDIERIVVHETGFEKKKAVIVTRTGKNVHVAESKSEVMKHVEEFSIRHHIPMGREEESARR